ncbi:reverse transcriptase [Cucumis melo var. makuwa]|uniref:Reverse transcriptase n=1 Tax=Cucumis melo var. makuwa TaxID=1194695 RepID=A0A5A7UXL4_CUCMM|nr:reverse transcriptase [Cucumis melo var. makuwa]
MVQFFKELKKRLVTTPILALPVTRKDYVIYCDTSRLGLGCVLMQDENKELNLRQRRWLELIKDYDYTIEYHQGKTNVASDALSRKSRLPKSALCGIRVALLNELRGSKAVVTTEDSGSLLAQFQVRSSLVAEIGRLCVPNISELKNAILEEAHSSAYAIDPGSTKMYTTLKKTYWWPGMKQEIAEYVDRCLICEHVKPIRQRPGGFLNPMPVPEWKWEHITMNFLFGLPLTSSGHDGIWVIVDRLTKTARFIPIKATSTLDQLARLYVNKIVSQYGVPVSIVSDRDPRFTSKFWPSLQKTIGTGLKFRSWDIHLPLMEFAYNNSYQSSIGMAPYEALYGRPCKTPVCWKEVREKKLVDKRQRNLKFQVGDQVFLKLSPWRGVIRFRRKDPSHVFQEQPVELKEDLSYAEEPVQILDRKEQVLRNKTIPLIKVLWRHHRVEKATWEPEDQMKKRYPILFS